MILLLSLLNVILHGDYLTHTLISLNLALPIAELLTYWNQWLYIVAAPKNH